MAERTIDEAIQLATKLNEDINRKGVASAYSELERAIRAFENEGYPLDCIIPTGEDSRLGFSLRSADGRTFFQIYSNLIRKRLCTPNGEFNKLIKGGVNSSVGAVLTAIVSSLGIPAVALGIMIPVAVIIANTGIDAFCALTEPVKKP